VVFEGEVTFQVLAQDDSGVERVVVTYSKDGENWESLDLTYDSEGGYWEGQLTDPVLSGGEVSYFVQAVDGVGNVSMSANKGLFFEPEEHSLYLPLIMRDYP
jgi:hypothetical protein